MYVTHQIICVRHIIAKCQRKCNCFIRLFVRVKRISGEFLNWDCCTITFRQKHIFRKSFRFSGLFRPETGHFHTLMLKPQASRLGEAFVLLIQHPILDLALL